MRITNGMINERTLFNIQKSLYRISKLHDKLSSGKEVSYPSDDAVVATRSSNISSRLRELKQFKRNVEHTQNFVNIYDSTIQELTNVYHRIKELIVRGANGVNDVAERESIAEELKELKNHLEDIANTQLGGEYIFGGARSDLKPVENGKIQTPPEANVKRKVNALGFTIEYGITVYDVFKLDTGKDAFTVINDAINALKEGNSKKLSNITLKEVNKLETSTMDVFAQIGANTRTLELISTRITDIDTFMTEYLSKEQDADLTKVLTDLSMQQSVLQAALKSAAQVLQKTLVDFV
ncbi:flagellar hook protein FlgL [Thermosipho sp. 1063]|uniref:flagellar hook-associated protein FlgL n=1 Tax=unclassified Thermosipho (in: thermotogales) TaxID=2676525 RepID=UPI00094942A9|nr:MULTISPECIES: flagellar hook-associated protein FlgL [unclassified Thermosipho (in: thermotogales)]ANQ53433.1 flagellar hook protein FlgL [Thermosipho sp. 1070]APT71882.1 flagellar hook protein FlgL [Thermosipho sp. 1063]OOC45018.1 flagellar hook protein FlgL [Thermosipho sp. 1074]